MTGLEKITSQIQEEAEASARERSEAARQEAERILAEAKAACDSMEREAAGRDAAFLENQQGRAASSAEQQRKLVLLETRQEIIADVIADAYRTLKEEDTASYFLTMEKLLKTYVLAEDGEICFSAADLDRMPADFEKKIKEAAKEKGGSLTLRREPADIESGFVLIYGGIEENCTLKALFDAKRDQMQDRVNEILFL
ncbi:MAG: V-type ATP synthase subunit E [Eubacteriales bacterium]|nr:V-type ATP synthase subunit E [Eubacteriales bacterium]